MDFFRKTNINFVGAMRPAFAVSTVLVVLSIVLLILHGGPRLSIDFTGGAVLQVRIDPVPEISDIRDALAEQGVAGAQVQDFGAPGEFLINVSLTDDEVMDASQVLLDGLKAGMPSYEIELRREEAVGPKIGGELKTAAQSSVLAALVFIVLYISVRFVFRYGIAAIVALVHDVTLTLGVFSLLNMEISLSIIAAFLTIIGYSLNDTIVVFDRIRENMRLRRKESYAQVVNRSINECLSRTMLTSLTTLFVAGALFFFGGPVIHDFAFALCFGVIVGTYSSMFIASPILVWWYDRGTADRKRAQQSL